MLIGDPNPPWVEEREKKSRIVVLTIRIPAAPEEAEDLQQRLQHMLIHETPTVLNREHGSSIAIEDRKY